MSGFFDLLSYFMGWWSKPTQSGPTGDPTETRSLPFRARNVYLSDRPRNIYLEDR